MPVETTVLPGGRRREAALMRQVMMTKMMMGIANSTRPPNVPPTPDPTATLLPESVRKKPDLFATDLPETCCNKFNKTNPY